MPPVTNAPHAGTTATTQFQKTYASHAYNTAKGLLVFMAVTSSVEHSELLAISC